MNMSLKAFHIVFITVSTLLFVGFGVWSLRMYQHSGGTANLAFGIGSLVGAVALVIYGRFFLKKLKSVSYL
jgi:hypothetical protein